MSEIKMLRAFGEGKQEYVVNGVRYIVSSRFQPLKPKAEIITLKNRMCQYLGNELAESIPTDNSATIVGECVSTAGKEE